MSRWLAVFVILVIAITLISMLVWEPEEDPAPKPQPSATSSAPSASPPAPRPSVERTPVRSAFRDVVDLSKVEGRWSAISGATAKLTSRANHELEKRRKGIYPWYLELKVPRLDKPFECGLYNQLVEPDGPEYEGWRSSYCWDGDLGPEANAKRVVLLKSQDAKQLTIEVAAQRHTFERAQ
jgi:hypothetical protein